MNTLQKFGSSVLTDRAHRVAVGYAYECINGDIIAVVEESIATNGAAKKYLYRVTRNGDAVNGWYPKREIANLCAGMPATAQKVGGYCESTSETRNILRAKKVQALSGVVCVEDARSYAACYASLLDLIELGL